MFFPRKADRLWKTVFSEDSKGRSKGEGTEKTTAEEVDLLDRDSPPALNLLHLLVFTPAASLVFPSAGEGGVYS